MRTLEIQKNNMRLTPQGTPSFQICDGDKRNVAVFVEEDDAKMFVAAPEMLEALKDVIDNGYSLPLASRIQEIITRATA